MEPQSLFGLVCEGPSDQLILRYLLGYWYKNLSLDINELQPLEGEYGGWSKVIAYCGSEEFRDAFAFVQYLIIQIDTDVSEEKGFDVSKRKQDGTERSIAELREAIKARLIQAIGEDFYEEFQDRIFFAISIHEMECWLLPFFATPTKKYVNKKMGCLDTLNRAYLTPKLGFSIDPVEKQVKYYQKLLRFKQLKKALKKQELYQNQLSLDLFVRSLPELSHPP
ncbi:MAG: phage tail protein [Bacteroidota bacterium]